MLRVQTSISIYQVTQIVGQSARNKTISFNFVNELTCSDSWRDFTNDAKIVVPKNLYVKDKNNKTIAINGTNQNIGGFSDSTPLLMRGDKVTIDWGYKYFKNGVEIFEGTYDPKNNTHLFQGYISEVTSKKPIEFKCEDNFWKLKQAPAPIHTFRATDSLETIINFMLANYNIGKYPDDQFTFNPITTTTFGEFRIGNETIAEVLGRLRKDYHFESYFVGNELRCGVSVYNEATAKTHTFTFQKDIISDELDYRRKEDMKVSIAASNKIEQETGAITKDGHAKTKCQRLEVLVTLRNGSDTPEYFIKQKGKDYPPNIGGERSTLTYPGAKSISDLEALALAELIKYYYTGFKGHFTTFGMPYVQVGDNVKLIDPVLPERNGLYKVRAVDYSCTVTGGLRQKIQIDYLIV